MKVPPPQLAPFLLVCHDGILHPLSIIQTAPFSVLGPSSAQMQWGIGTRFYGAFASRRSTFSIKPLSANASAAGLVLTEQRSAGLSPRKQAIRS